MNKFYNIFNKYLYPNSLRYSKNPIIKNIRQFIAVLVPGDWKAMEKLKPDWPELAIIDISSVCNLHCPLCPTGAGTIRLQQGLMSLDNFKKYLDKIPSLKYLYLFNWGEPFLNPQILTMINYAKTKNIFVNIDSNFSFELNDEKLLRLIKSGLDNLQISLDGATAASYNKYRQNGNFELVYSNLKRLRQLQKEQGSASPKIIWKFIVNKYNQSEIEQAKKMASEIEVEIIFSRMGLTDDIVDLQVDQTTTLPEKMSYWLPGDNRFIHDKYLATNQSVNQGVCPMLFKNIFVHSTGQILPCCYTANESSFMGDLNNQTLSEIWNNDKYLYARSLFYPEAKVKKVPVVCENCHIFTKSGVK